MSQSLTGDGCRYCQPQEYIDRLEEWLEEERAELNHAQERVAELESTYKDATTWEDVGDVFNKPTSIPWLLRKQAEAVEAATNEHEIKIATDDSMCYSVALRDYAKRLRQQADKIEND
jgi:hypothetical protein